MTQHQHQSIAHMIAAPLLGKTLTGSGLVLAEWTADGCPPDTEPMRMAPLHRHLEDDEAWYVLEGTLAFQLGDEIIEADSGSAVLAPRGVKHTFWNPKQAPARYLIIMTKRISELIDAIHATEQRDSATMQALFARYGSELLG
ncbi:cupin domain-containing protein [Paenibacillus silvisoli]|uniref:cupin domain-containing protein n=1 Tax=Paenibacillus silvisoli TaxID=3110539 RepID=UPI00280655B0|nr:cupin domain-containing protein [Paenibacillus silvisoli]